MAWDALTERDPDTQMTLFGHVHLLVTHGIHILENLNLEALAAAGHPRVRVHRDSAEVARRDRVADSAAGTGGDARLKPSRSMAISMERERAGCRWSDVRMSMAPRLSGRAGRRWSATALAERSRSVRRAGSGAARVAAAAARRRRRMRERFGRGARLRREDRELLLQLHALTRRADGRPVGTSQVLEAAAAAAAFVLEEGHDPF
jgi:hypothetical protein